LPPTDGTEESLNGDTNGLVIQI